MDDMGHMSTTNIMQEPPTVKQSEGDPLDELAARRRFHAVFDGKEFSHTSSPVYVQRENKAMEKKAAKEGFELTVSPDAPQSPELLYQWELEVDEDLRLGGKVENGFDNTFYRWHEDANGACYWESQKDEHSINHALLWLRENLSAKYSKDKAEKMVDTARAGMLLNPKKTIAKPNSKSVVVGVQGAYLHINTQTGLITAQEPNKDAGLTCCVPATFDWDRVEEAEGIYWPNPVDPKSYFGRWLDLFMPDLGVRGILQEAVASSFLPVCYEKCFVLYGTGANGKSTFMHLLRALHPGPQTVAMDMAGLSGEYGIQDFLGARNAICTECPKHIDDATANRLKALSSWDPVPLNRKYKDRVTIVARVTPWFAVNHHITFNDHSYGMQRRLLLIPFSVRMAPENKDRIPDYHKLITENPAEMSALMDWVLEGAARLVRQGGFSAAPEAVQELTKAAEQQTNVVLAFLDDEAAHVSDGVWTKKTDIYRAFDEYRRSKGNKEWSDQKFWEQVRAKFHDVPYAEKQMKCSKERKVCRYVAIKFENIPGITAMQVVKAQAAEKKTEAVIEGIFNNQVPVDEEAA